MTRTGITLVHIALGLSVFGGTLGVVLYTNERVREEEMKAAGKDPEKRYVSNGMIYVDKETGCEYLTRHPTDPLVPRLGSDGRPLCRSKPDFWSR